MFRRLLPAALFFLAILTILTTEAAVGKTSRFLPRLPRNPLVIDPYFAVSVADP
jgi:hypothetical protein